MYAYFERFELKLTKDQALSGSHQGQCDDDVGELLKLPAIKRQLSKISDDTLSEELREYGAWDSEELADRSANEARIVWIACGHIREELQSKGRA